MMVYIINLLLLFVLGFVYYYSKKKKVFKFLMIVLISLYMIILVSFRSYNIGWDTLNYVGFFESVSNLSFIDIIKSNTELEKGYMVFQLLISKLSKSPTMLFLIIGAFYISSFSRLIAKYSKEPILSYLLFISLGFFTFGMTAVRQSLSLAIVFFAIPKIVDRKLLSFFFIVLFASLFHRTALVFIPAYWLYNININRKRLSFGLLIVPLFYLLRFEIFDLLTSLTGYEYGYLDQEGPLVLGTLMILIFISIIVLLPNMKKNDKETKLFIVFMYSGLLLSILAFVHPAALRAAYYYIVYIILLIPSVLIMIKENNIRMMVYIISITVLLILYSINLLSQSPFVPYEFIF